MALRDTEWFSDTGATGPIDTYVDPTKSFSKNAATQIASQGINAGLNLAGGIATNVQMSKAGDQAQTQSMETLAQRDADAKADRALQRKKRALVNEQDTYRRMNDILGVEFNKFQRDLQNRLQKYQEMQGHADTMRTAYERNQQIKDAQIAQAEEL